MLKGIFCCMILGWSLGGGWCLDICNDQVEGARLAHPADCSRFIICRQGVTAQIRYCPFGLHFNRFDAICDLQYRAGCDNRYSRQLLTYEEANRIDCDVCKALCSAVKPLGIKAEKPPCTKPEKPPTTPCPTPPTPKPTTSCRPTVPTPELPPSPPTKSPKPPAPSPPTKPCLPPRPPTPQPTTKPPKPSPTTKPCLSPKPTTPPPSTKPCRPPKPSTPPTPTPPSTADPSTDDPNPEAPQTNPSGLTCADHGKCEGQRDGALFADSSSTGYIVCQCQCEIIMPCPPTLIFNEAKQSCDWPQD